MAARKQLRAARLGRLIEEFPRYLAVFTEQPPFSRSGQWEHHAHTIELRRAAGSVEAAIEDPAFVESLWLTLRAWGIGIRGSRLVERRQFHAELARCRLQLARLGGLTLASDGAGRTGVWDLVQHLEITNNRAKLVALTKTLHHLLPDLVVPIDRAYTGTFFAYNVAEFQVSQRPIFDTVWAAFSRIAGEARPTRYVGDGWNTSATKVIDNAIIGFCIAEGLQQSKQTTPKLPGLHIPTRSASGSPRRETWTIRDLESDLDAFAGELRDAGLKQSSIDTYVGRSETFVRWLAGRYQPRGPNS